MVEFTTKRYELLIGLEKDRNNNEIDRGLCEIMLATIKHRAAVEFGGYTIIDIAGGWYCGMLIEERGIQLVICTDRPIEDVEHFVDFLCYVCKQRSIMLCYAGSVAEVKLLADCINGDLDDLMAPHTEHDHNTAKKVEQILDDSPSRIDQDIEDIIEDLDNQAEVDKLVNENALTDGYLYESG